MLRDVNKPPEAMSQNTGKASWLPKKEELKLYYSMLISEQALFPLRVFTILSITYDALFFSF